MRSSDSVQSSVEFACAVLEGAKRFTRNTTALNAWQLAHELPQWARYVPTETLGEASAGWPPQGDWEKPVDRFLQLLQFRHDMIQSIQET
jgi:hypothetical protein